MKNEKLKLMLNKVVEYNNPKANKGKGSHFKAFLYKNSHGYYFKVVEIVNDNNISFNNIIYLKDGDEKFLIIADKPRLMRISKKSWHYRLLKYVLKSQAPTPHDMQNGCPYFWLVMFSLLVLPFILIFKVTKWTILLIPKMLFWILKQMVLDWIASLDDEAAYELQHNGNYGDIKMPKTAKIFFNNSDDDFFSLFLSKKYKVDNHDDPNYAECQKEIKEKWRAWRDDLDIRREEQRIRNNERETERCKRKAIYDKKRAEASAKWEIRMKPIKTGFNNIGQWFKKIFTVERGKRNMIVKRTKQFIGTVVTFVILAATFVVVNYISLILMVIIDAIINGGWIYFMYFAILGIIIGIFYLLYILISSWGQAVVNKYQRGKKVWYIEPIIYLVWYPVKYLALAIAFIISMIIWIPFKFIFYTCIWRILSWIGIRIGRCFLSLGKGIIGSTGIFGEYFGASYSDYCPGLEWVDFDEE